MRQSSRGSRIKGKTTFTRGQQFQNFYNFHGKRRQLTAPCDPFPLSIKTRINPKAESHMIETRLFIALSVNEPRNDDKSSSSFLYFASCHLHALLPSSNPTAFFGRLPPYFPLASLMKRICESIGFRWKEWVEVVSGSKVLLLPSRYTVINQTVAILLICVALRREWLLFLFGKTFPSICMRTLVLVKIGFWVAIDVAWGVVEVFFPMEIVDLL